MTGTATATGRLDELSCRARRLADLCEELRVRAPEQVTGWVATDA